jgi:hypothetical protein
MLAVLIAVNRALLGNIPLKYIFPTEEDVYAVPDVQLAQVVVLVEYWRVPEVTNLGVTVPCAGVVPSAANNEKVRY